MLKLITILALVHIAVILCDSKKKFIILNKDTGLVMDGTVADEAVDLKRWVHKDVQLWYFEPTDDPGYYFIQNVKTGKVLDLSPTKVILSYSKWGTSNQKWLIDTFGYQRLHVANYPKSFLISKDDKIKLVSSEPNDESDKWLLIESC